jgi:hypothetical protein
MIGHGIFCTPCVKKRQVAFCNVNDNWKQYPMTYPLRQIRGLVRKELQQCPEGDGIFICGLSQEGINTSYYE